MTAVYPEAQKKEGALDLMGIPVHAVDADAIHHYIAEVIAKNQRALVLNVNINAVNLALDQPWMKELFCKAQMVFCDGDGVRWGFRLLGQTPPPKVTYDRWIWQLASFAAEKGLSLYFLGGKPGIAEQAAARIRHAIPNLRMAGMHHGYFKKEGPENEQVIQEINQTRPDILILGFGMPIQEKWLQNHWHKVAAHVFLTGGAVFDYAAGHAKRAPDWMIRANMEWLYRFLQEPRRLFSRYILGNPYFMFRIFCEKLKRMFRS